MRLIAHPCAGERTRRPNLVSRDGPPPLLDFPPGIHLMAGSDGPFRR